MFVDLSHLFIVNWRTQHGHCCMDLNLLHPMNKVCFIYCTQKYN